MIDLDPEVAATRRETRDFLEQKGSNIAAVATGGDFVVVQLVNKSEAFVVGEVQGNDSYRRLEEDCSCWLGKIPRGSQVLPTHHSPATMVTDKQG